ncbi:hypothetical protein LAZ67_12000456 [Cordylochernes scorpioides]|uniref:Integrase catalytic domain-containing protein n=1 Tax=Cordylochernes scorpioides TaxID=51811 RepID=A0ABY6L0I3_9ARAC|nr:hypothetical protein LAZ67_12000456 [Cordylochernes scorpioides]
MEGIKPPAEFVSYSNEKKWETWRESFEIFAIAVNLESMPLVRQRAILKHIAGEKKVMIYKTFHISENDTYPNVKEMLDMLTNHFKPFKNTIQRRNAFFTCVQKEKQGIMEFVTELKHLAQECEFENLTESLIRDRVEKPHLLVVDRYSGYPEVFTLDPPTAINVKNKLRETFARFGIPETMMSDNGPPFRSEIMTDFCIRWGIKQLFSSPHLHRSNGLAERNIQTIKNQLIKCRDEGSDPYLAILAYRNTPKNDLPSPAQLCLSRSLRCQIPRITPLYRPYQTNWRSIENAKRKRQSSMKEQYDRNSKSYPKVNVGEDAWCQIHPRETWTPVKISAQADSPQSFEVVTPSGNRLIRNQQFIRPRDGGYEKIQLSSEPITASPEAQHPQCYSPTMGESSTAPIQRSSEETNIHQREGATTSAGIAPEPSGRPRFSRFGRELRKPQRFVWESGHRCRIEMGQSKQNQLTRKFHAAVVWEAGHRCRVEVGQSKQNQLTRNFHAEVQSGSLAIDVGLRWYKTGVFPARHLIGWHSAKPLGEAGLLPPCCRPMSAAVLSQKHTNISYTIRRVMIMWASQEKKVCGAPLHKEVFIDRFQRRGWEINSPAGAVVKEGAEIAFDLKGVVCREDITVWEGTSVW